MPLDAEVEGEKREDFPPGPPHVGNAERDPVSLHRDSCDSLVPFGSCCYHDGVCRVKGGRPREPPRLRREGSARRRRLGSQPATRRRAPGGSSERRHHPVRKALDGFPGALRVRPRRRGDDRQEDVIEAQRRQLLHSADLSKHRALHALGGIDVRLPPGEADPSTTSTRLSG